MLRKEGRAVLLKPSPGYESPGGVVKMQMPIQQVSEG